MATRLPLTLVAALSACCGGCYSTWDIAPRNVMSLHVDPETAEKMVIASDGAAVVVDRDTELLFHARGPMVPELDVKFESLAVVGAPGARDGKWWVSGVLRGDGRGIRVDMNEVTSLMAKRYSPGKTTALVVGVVLAVCLVTAVATVKLVQSFSSSD
jgi:hypothetical protein